MRIFVFLMLLVSFLISDMNVSNKVFLRLNTGGHTATIRDIIVTKSKNIISASDDKTR